MNIRHQLTCQNFFPLIVQPAISITKKIALGRCKTSNLFTVLERLRFRESIPSKQYTAEVGNIFSLGCVPVHVQSVNRIEMIKLLNDSGSTRVELLYISGLP